MTNIEYICNIICLNWFQLGVVGHFEAIHDWETNKPAETMWVSAEMWDEEAQQHFMHLKQGIQKIINNHL